VVIGYDRESFGKLNGETIFGCGFRDGLRVWLEYKWGWPLMALLAGLIFFRAGLFARMHGNSTLDGSESDIGEVDLSGIVL
jgi:hypothetical protein